MEIMQNFVGVVVNALIQQFSNVMIVLRPSTFKSVEKAWLTGMHILYVWRVNRWMQANKEGNLTPPNLFSVLTIHN